MKVLILEDIYRIKQQAKLENLWNMLKTKK
mgnify:CR=1 FL=1